MTLGFVNITFFIPWHFVRDPLPVCNSSCVGRAHNNLKRYGYLRYLVIHLKLDRFVKGSVRRKLYNIA